MQHPHYKKTISLRSLITSVFFFVYVIINQINDFGYSFLRQQSFALE